MIGELPASVLVIGNAGDHGFDLARRRNRAERAFLIRLSSTVRLVTEPQGEMASDREGLVSSWPVEAPQRGRPPLRVRRIRAAGKVPGTAVWLLTNVLERARLSVALASRFSKLRWGKEGMFPTSQRTLKQVKRSAARCAPCVARRLARCWRRHCSWPRGR